MKVLAPWPLAAVLMMACLGSAPSTAALPDRDDPESSVRGGSTGEIRRLAEVGRPDAQFALGQLHEYGRGIDQDDAAAVHWYRRAASQGHVRAQYRLGVLHDNGWGVEEDDHEAVDWYRRAALQGHPLALHDLAFMYIDGTGVARDFVRGYMWLDVAVGLGFVMMAPHREYIAQRMTPAEVAEARRMAASWLSRRPR